MLRKGFRQVLVCPPSFLSSEDVAPKLNGTAEDCPNANGTVEDCPKEKGAAGGFPKLNGAAAGCPIEVCPKLGGFDESDVPKPLLLCCWMPNRGWLVLAFWSVFQALRNDSAGSALPDVLAGASLPSRSPLAFAGSPNVKGLLSAQSVPPQPPHIVPAPVRFDCHSPHIHCL